MLELFSRVNMNILKDHSSQCIPLHLGEDISSLSAILLNETYYQFLLSGRIKIREITILEPMHLIPFKAKAWLDLKYKHESGLHVDSGDIKKHKNDIIRLATILIENAKCELPYEIQNDMNKIVHSLETEIIDLPSLNISNTEKSDIINILIKVYSL